MEQGEIQSWSQTDKIDKVRRAHAQMHLVGQGITVRTQLLVDLNEFGFPLDFDSTCALESTVENHAFARNYPTHVDVHLGRNWTMLSHSICTHLH